MFWAPSSNGLPAMVSRTAVSPVKGGHSTTSTRPGSPSASTMARASSRPSSTVVFIFQLPATMGRRISLFIHYSSLVVQRGDAGQRLAFQELQRGAAAGGDMGHFAGQAERLDRRDRVAAADDADGPAIGDGLGD